MHNFSFSLTTTNEISVDLFLLSYLDVSVHLVFLYGYIYSQFEKVFFFKKNKSKINYLFFFVIYTLIILMSRNPSNAVAIYILPKMDSNHRPDG